MRRPVVTRKATTQKRNNNAGIIGQQVYLSCARCNALQRRGLALLSSGRADARQPGLATNRGVAMNNSALRRFVDGRDECSDVGGLSVRVSARLLRVRVRLKTWRLRRARRWVWRARLAADLVLAMEKNSGRERHGCSWICQPRCGAIKPIRSQRSRGVGLLCLSRRVLGVKRRNSRFLRARL